VTLLPFTWRARPAKAPGEGPLLQANAQLGFSSFGSSVRHRERERKKRGGGGREKEGLHALHHRTVKTKSDYLEDGAVRGRRNAVLDRARTGAEEDAAATTRRDVVTSPTVPQRLSRPRLHHRPSVSQCRAFSSPHPWERAPASRRWPLSRALFVRPPQWRTPTPHRSLPPFSRYAVVYPCPVVEP
jgi:hypothetical protein